MSEASARRSVADLRALVNDCVPDGERAMLDEIAADPRAGAQALARALERRIAAREAEAARLDSLMALQDALHGQGHAVVAGVDEVGRGALAGPLTLAAVVLDRHARIVGLDDSKRLAPSRREEIAVAVHDVALAVAIIHIEPAEIDRLGIAQACRTGMARAVAAIGRPVDHTIVDGNDTRLSFPSTAVVGGDRMCACVAAASVVAKVARDALMVRLAPEHPDYGFEVNKGYGTPEHLAALAELGPSPQHRRSFAPCAQAPLF